MAKPVDHSALKKKIEREQKLEFEKSKPKHLLKRSRSRSEKKLLDKSLRRQYKSFVKKFNKEIVEDEEDENQWRGTNDFTRVTQEDERKSLRDSLRHPLSRKLSNAEKREISRSNSRERFSGSKKRDFSREITRTNSKEVFSGPRSFLQSKE